MTGIACLVLLLASLEAVASFSGTLKSSNDYYPQSINEEIDDLVPYVLVDIGGKNKITKKLRWQWKLSALANLESEGPPEQLYADLPEAFFEYKMSELRARIGMNTLNWGVVDISSPSDVVNPTAFFHPLRSRKRGAPMVELDWSKEVIGLHAVYIPTQQRALLPSADSRWLPRKVLMNVQNDYARIILPDFIEYEFGRPETLDRATDHNAGVRLSSHLGSWDLFAMHFEGASPSPKVRPTINIIPGSVANEGIAISPIRLSTVHYRVRTSSLGWVWAGEEWIWRAETAYQHTISDDPLLQPWSWTSVMALETNVDVGSSTITLLGQYYHTENPQSPDNLISSSYRLFDRTGVFGFRWPPTEELLITGSLVYELNAHGTFAMIGFENKLSDVLRWGLGWRDFYAPEDGLIKTFEKNDHATLDLTYYF